MGNVKIDWFGTEEELDERFAPLMEELVKSNIWTYPYVGETHFGELILHFLHSCEAESFVEIIEKVNPDFYGEEVLDGSWEWSAEMEDRTSNNEPLEVVFSIVLRFPKIHFGKVLEIFQQWNKQKAIIVPNDLSSPS